MTPELKQLLKRTAKEYGQKPTPAQSRRNRQRLYNQVQPLFTVLGFVLALFWLAPTPDMAPDTAPPQTIQAGVSK